MSADTVIHKFLKTLSTRDRHFFIVMETYKQSLVKLQDHDEYNSIISNMFEPLILKLLSYNDKSSHENYGGKQIQDEDVEKSIKKKLKAVKQTDHEFDEKLGDWASSFSKSGDEDKIFSLEL
jgi:hypothetical protein